MFIKGFRAFQRDTIHHHSLRDGSGNIGDHSLINIDAIQQVVAAKWAVDVINNQSLPHK